MRVDRSETRAAGQRVNVIAGQQYNLSGVHLHCGLAFDSEKKPSVDNKVIGDQRAGAVKNGPQSSAESLVTTHQGAVK